MNQTPDVSQLPSRYPIWETIQGCIIRPPVKPQTTIVLVVLISAAMCIAGGSASQYVIPACSTIAAYVLARISPRYYINYVWWTFFVACLIRRYSDYRTTYTEGNLILAAPALAVLPAVLPLLRRSLWRMPEVLPFKLAIAVIVYGCLLGVLYISPKALAIAALSWVVPIVFGLYTFTTLNIDTGRDELIGSMRQTFAWALVVMSFYGVLQYVIAPGWDTMWITDSKISSVGSAEPYGFRVFSTMNGPGALAITLVAGLIWIVGMTGVLPLVAGAAGLITLLLTSVRAGWLALVIGGSLFVVRQRRKLGRIVIVLIVGGMCISGAMVIDPIRELLQPRFESFIKLGDDTSYQERQAGYAQMVGFIEASPFGTGLGSMETLYSDKTSLGARDSGFLDSLLSLGWLGAAVYLFALCMVAWKIWPRTTTHTDVHLASACIFIGLLSQVFFGVIMVGLGGILVWSFAGIALSEVRLLSNDGAS